MDSWSDCLERKPERLVVEYYTPDMNPQQAYELKARLRELGYGYRIWWREDKKVHRIEIRCVSANISSIMGESTLSESAALLDAVSKIPQKGD